ncbi:MAG: hypothetical protein GY866_18400 [Proteobacteria bacterium]|nr:hypothetical protein [Pseudomonadota bacterium]
MDQNIHELTSVIYKEGIEKGEEEAKKIIEDSKKESTKIINEAKAEASKILQEAENEAENLKKINQSEVKLAGLKAVRAIRQRITDTITAKALDGHVAEAMSGEKIRDYIKIILKNWKENDGKGLELLLPEKEQQKLQDSFISEISKTLKSNIELNFTKNIRGGFQIGPKNGGYKISLTEEDFNEFFKQYLNARTRKFLFSESVSE